MLVSACFARGWADIIGTLALYIGIIINTDLVVIIANSTSIAYLNMIIMSCDVQCQAITVTFSKVQIIM